MIEPYLIPAVTPAPAIAVDAQGYAQPVSITGSTSGLSAAPRQIQPDTIRWLDREAAAGADPADTGNLADLRDVIFWRGELPSGTVTGTHSAGPGPAFGLRTDGGGALFFYSLTARLRLLAPPGDTFHVSIPGYYSPSQVPPVGHGGLHRAVRRLRPGPREGRPAGRRSRLQHRRAGIHPAWPRTTARGPGKGTCFPFPGPGPAEKGNRRSCLRGSGLAGGRARAPLTAGSLPARRERRIDENALPLTAGMHCIPRVNDI